MKRPVPYPEARRILARVAPSDSFWLCTNDNLRSLADIAKILEEVDDEVFRYHVTRDKNDFEVWIRDVLRDKELAREIARVKTKETLIRKISERVESLRSVTKRHRTSLDKKRSKRTKKKQKTKKSKRAAKKPKRTKKTRKTQAKKRKNSKKTKKRRK